MIKRTISLGLIGVLFLVTTSLATAQDVRPFRAAEEHREEVQTNISDRKAELRCQVAQVHQRRLDRRFGFYYARLSKMIDKVQGWIDRLTDDGKDLSDAQTKLDESSSKLDDAKEAADASIDGFGRIDELNCEGQRDQALEARDYAQAARSLFKEALQLMKEAFRLVKVEIPSSEGE